MDEVTKTISVYNKQLVSLSTWQNPSLTTNGVAHLALCSNLRELDVGWCLMLSEAGNSLELISRSCCNLRKLVIAGWRGMSDQYLKHIIIKCPELYHLDILGIRNITGEIGELALKSLPNLKLLDISFCALISRDQVNIINARFLQIINLVCFVRCKVGEGDILMLQFKGAVNLTAITIEFFFLVQKNLFSVGVSVINPNARCR